MKKLLLLSMIVPMIGISQSIDELMKVYGNAKRSILVYGRRNIPS